MGPGYLLEYLTKSAFSDHEGFVKHSSEYRVMLPSHQNVTGSSYKKTDRSWMTSELATIESTWIIND